jgi:hypothetical protein
MLDKTCSEETYESMDDLHQHFDLCTTAYLAVEMTEIEYFTTFVGTPCQNMAEYTIHLYDWIEGEEFPIPFMETP